MHKIKAYLHLMRLNKPIGIWLLLWPTLWGLWIAKEGIPSLKILLIFVCGVVLMRAAGCVVNDITDRDIDPKVQRTRTRPLATGEISVKEAWILFFSLCFLAFLLLFALNELTFKYAILGLLLASIYPWMKRIIYFPQAILGIAFSWGIVMAFTAIQQAIPLKAWFLFCIAVLWPVIYDTQYAMADREDDLKIGIKSTAILFGRLDRLIIGILQIIFIGAWVLFAITYRFHLIFYGALGISAFLMGYQQYLMRHRQAKSCFKAFLNNQWVGLVIFLGIILSV